MVVGNAAENDGMNEFIKRTAAQQRQASFGSERWGSPLSWALSAVPRPPRGSQAVPRTPGRQRPRCSSASGRGRRGRPQPAALTHVHPSPHRPAPSARGQWAGGGRGAEGGASQ